MLRTPALVLALAQPVVDWRAAGSNARASSIDARRHRSTGATFAIRSVPPTASGSPTCVSTIDVKEDKSTSHIWMVGFDGKDDRQITFSQDGESSPRWSPDGKYLSFTSSRPGKAKGSQIWLLDRNGGEAFQLTEFKGRLQSYEWSPDSKAAGAGRGRSRSGGRERRRQSEARPDGRGAARRSRS